MSDIEDIELRPVGLFSYGPLVPWRAWRPTDTRDAGWVWLRRITRQRVYINADGYTGRPFWATYRYRLIEREYRVTG